MNTTEYYKHIARLMSALFVSATWEDAYPMNKDSSSRFARQRAIYARARGVVVFDRVLNDKSWSEDEEQRSNYS